MLSRECGTGRDRRFCVPSKDWEGEIKAIGDAFRDPQSPIGGRYVRDPILFDTYTSAVKTIRTRSFDCDDAAVALAALYGSVGYSVKFVPVSAKGAQGAASHIYIRVAVPPGAPERAQKWIPVDVTVPHPIGWEVPRSAIEREWEFLV